VRAAAGAKGKNFGCNVARMQRYMSVVENAWKKYVPCREALACHPQSTLTTTEQRAFHWIRSDHLQPPEIRVRERARDFSCG